MLPLHYAAEKGASIEVVAVLLEANPAAGNYSRTAVAHVQASGVGSDIWHVLDIYSEDEGVYCNTVWMDGFTVWM